MTPSPVNQATDVKTTIVTSVTSVKSVTPLTSVAEQAEVKMSEVAGSSTPVADTMVQQAVSHLMSNLSSSEEDEKNDSGKCGVWQTMCDV